MEKVVKYVAFDGEVFYDEDEALAHEASLIRGVKSLHFFDEDGNPIEKVPGTSDFEYLVNSSYFIRVDDEEGFSVLSFFEDEYGYSLPKQVSDNYPANFFYTGDIPWIKSDWESEWQEITPLLEVAKKIKEVFGM